MVEFLNSLGLKGAVGFLELSITGVPLLHVVTAGVYLLIAFYNKSYYLIYYSLVDSLDAEVLLLCWSCYSNVILNKRMERQSRCTKNTNC